MNRYTIQFSARFDRMLTELSKQDDLTKAETVRRAVVFYSAMRNAINKSQDPTLILVDGATGKELVFLTDVIFPETSTDQPRRGRPRKVVEEESKTAVNAAA